jgi:hypothetical protein
MSSKSAPKNPAKTATPTASAQQARRAPGAQPKYDRQAVSAQICSELKLGRSLDSICKMKGMPTPATFLDWIKSDPDGIGKQYAHAREIGYTLLADEIVALSDKTHEWVMTQELDSDGRPMYDEAGEPRLKRVLMPLNSDVVAHKRVQIDTRKWMLSKMLPKVYGEKVTQEHTGAGGGPIALAAVDLKGLTDDELEQAQRLLAKASKAE